MLKKFIKWFVEPSKKPVVEEVDVYTKLLELQERIVKLEIENIETTNTLYEIMNSIDAVDSRIDILSENPWKEQFDV